MTSLGLVAIALVTLPALALVLWPLIRRTQPVLAAPAAAIGETPLALLEEKAAAYRALKELAFDYEAGHLSEDDYAALRQRYESRAAELLAALDALGPATAETSPPPEPTPARAAPAPTGLTRHPVALGAGAVIILVFGVVVGLNVGRFTESPPSMTPSGGRPLGADSPGGGGPVGPPPWRSSPARPCRPRSWPACSAQRARA